MHFVDFYPTKGAFAVGERIELRVITAGVSGLSPTIRLTIYHLAQVMDMVTLSLPAADAQSEIVVEWSAPAVSRGYGTIIELLDDSGRVANSAVTAFDILRHWSTFPRYGFLTDFVAGRTDISAALDTLSRFHINSLQFYDWQYRHDRLTPPEDLYRDPLGRELSRVTVSTLIEAAHARGMATMPYLAVYAASLSFWQEHPSWALYDRDGQPLTFEGFLGLMNPTPGTPWAEHLLAECSRVLAGLPFDGLHVDQYGDPKEGFSAGGDEVDLPGAFVAFVQALKQSHPDAAVVFNAVGNWPIEALAEAPLDFSYIEIWPPDVHYHDVWRIVANARKLTGGKPVVIALYLPAEQHENVLLADALILSLGGSRIELGENGRLLADPYFPKHQALPPELAADLRHYYDFVIRYGDLIGPAAGDPEWCQVQAPPELWPIVRNSPGWLAINLINAGDLRDPRWDQKLDRPEPQRAVTLTVESPGSVSQVWLAATGGDQRLRPVNWRQSGNLITVDVPQIDRWALVAMELENLE